MKLWLIIYAGSHIGGVFGPLPYGIDQCEQHRDNLRLAQTSFLTSGIDLRTGKPADPAKIDIARTIRFECESRASRPQLGGVE